MAASTLTLIGTTMTGLTLTGNDIFPGYLLINGSSQGTFTLPVDVQGFKTVGELKIMISNLADISLPWLEHVTGLLDYSSSNSNKELNLPHLKSVGAIQISTANSSLQTITLSELESITTGYTISSNTVGFWFTLSVSGITKLELPKLKSVVGGISITGLTAARKLETISFPKLESLTGTLTITGTSNTAFKDLSDFSKLTSAAGITISGFPQLKNFEPLKGVINSFAAEAWKISNCGYNPSYQDMIDGKYTN
jgi:hypothetical protein